VVPVSPPPRPHLAAREPVVRVVPAAAAPRRAPAGHEHGRTDREHRRSGAEPKRVEAEHPAEQPEQQREPEQWARQETSGHDGGERAATTTQDRTATVEGEDRSGPSAETELSLDDGGGGSGRD
jgi:hypothetical protein